MEPTECKNAIPHVPQSLRHNQLLPWSACEGTKRDRVAEVLEDINLQIDNAQLPQLGKMFVF